MNIHCAHAALVDITDLRPNPRNPNKHPDEQVALLAKNIRALGWRHPVIVSKRSGLVVAGHARIEAARLLGTVQVPVDYQDFASDAEETAYLIADNRIAELAERDNAAIKDLLQELDTGETDMDITGYTESVIEGMMNQVHVEDETPEKEKDAPSQEDMSEDNPKLAEFIRRREESRARGADKGEVNFCLCLVFQSWKQKQDFLAHFPDVPTRYGMYADGEVFATAVGKSVEKNEHKPIMVSVDKTLSGMVMP